MPTSECGVGRSWDPSALQKLLGDKRSGVHQEDHSSVLQNLGLLRKFRSYLLCFSSC